MDTEDMLEWRSHLGEVAVNAHTGEIGNGQETEPFGTQARDALINILHAMRDNWEPEEEGGLEFDADRILTSVTVNYNCESGS